MTQPTGSIRPLQYPYNRNEDIESNTPDEGITYIDLSDWVTNDPDERIDIVMNLSLNEYVALATAIDVGRDIAYGDNSLYIWWIWVRSLISLDICASVLDCIQTNESIQEAIANFAVTSNINSTTEQVSGNLSSQLVNNPVGCDNDIIFGMTRQLVEFSDRLIKDLFEQIDATQLASTNIGYLIKLIPVVETLPIDEAFELMDKLVDDMETAYLGASTQLLKDEIACDLFCLAQDNGCTLTLEQVRDYFQDKAGIVFSYNDVFSFLVDFINGTFVGNAVYYGMNILFFQIFAFGGTFIDYLFTDFLKTINSMYNDPDSDWSTVCDECGFVHVFDFTLSDGGFVPHDSGFGNRGIWVNGSGWETTDVQAGVSTYRRSTYPERFLSDTQLTSISITYDYTKGTFNSGNDTALLIRMMNNSVVLAQYSVIADDMVNGNGQVELMTATHVCDEIQLLVASSSQPTAVYDGACKITSCTVSGNGADPF